MPQIDHRFQTVSDWLVRPVRPEWLEWQERPECHSYHCKALERSPSQVFASQSFFFGILMSPIFSNWWQASPAGQCPQLPPQVDLPCFLSRTIEEMASTTTRTSTNEMIMVANIFHLQTKVTETKGCIRCKNSSPSKSAAAQADSRLFRLLPTIYLMKPDSTTFDGIGLSPRGQMPSP